MLKKYVTHGKALVGVEIALVGLICWIVLSSSLTAQPGSIAQASNKDAGNAWMQKDSQGRYVPPEGRPEPRSAQLIAAVATPSACQVFDFAGGASQGFTVVPVAGTPLATPLWHETNGLCRAFLTGHSTPYTFYYGTDLNCNYNTGARNASNLVSPTINLSGTFAPFSISFNYLLFVEGGGFDTTFVDLSTNGGTTWTQILSKADLINDNQWHNVSKDVTSVVGMSTSVRLRFRFDSIDNIANSTTGWHVDDITVCGAAFNFCLQSDDGGGTLQFNSVTGRYLAKRCDGSLTVEATGVVTTNGCTISLQDNTGGRNVSASVNTCTHQGNASISVKMGTMIKALSIVDSNTTNNTCICP
jgi:hypothetical protein